MRKTLWIFCVALGTALSCAAGGPKGGGSGPNATFTLACAHGVTATLDQVTVYNDASAVATMSGLCTTSSLTCSSNTATMVCVGIDTVTGAGFAIKGYEAGDTTLPVGGLHVTDSKGNTQNCIAEGAVPSKFGCTTITSKGVSFSVVNSK